MLNLVTICFINYILLFFFSPDRATNVIFNGTKYKLNAVVFLGFDSDLPECGTISKIIVFGNQDIYFLIITIIQHLNIINIIMHVTTRII